jgi:hypothetical protein
MSYVPLYRDDRGRLHWTSLTMISDFGGIVWQRQCVRSAAKSNCAFEFVSVAILQLHFFAASRRVWMAQTNEVIELTSIYAQSMMIQQKVLCCPNSNTSLKFEKHDKLTRAIFHSGLSSFSSF